MKDQYKLKISQMKESDNLKDQNFSILKTSNKNQPRLSKIISKSINNSKILKWENKLSKEDRINMKSPIFNCKNIIKDQLNQLVIKIKILSKNKGILKLNQKLFHSNNKFKKVKILF